MSSGGTPMSDLDWRDLVNAMDKMRNENKEMEQRLTVRMTSLETCIHDMKTKDAVTEGEWSLIGKIASKADTYKWVIFQGIALAALLTNRS